MSYYMDYQTINHAWKDEGPVHNFIVSAGQVLEGICPNIFIVNQNTGYLERAARRRTYELRYKDLTLRNLVMCDVEFCSNADKLKNYRTYKLFALIHISYGLVMGLKPHEIVFPGGIYSIQAERRAGIDYMRPMTRDEISKCHLVIQWLSVHVREKTIYPGMYCFNENRMREFLAEIERVLDYGKLYKDLGYIDNLNDMLSDKIRALFIAVRHNTGFVAA